MKYWSRIFSNPVTQKKIRRFQSIKRGYYSFLGLLVLILLSLAAELLVNNRALLVRHNGTLHFPTYGAMISGRDLGLDYDYECNYRDLQKKFAAEGRGDFVLLPLVPYNPYENDLPEGATPPTEPSIQDRHFLGTDSAGRDIVARLVYGFRIAIFFSLLLTAVTYVVGISLGCMMGYFGRWFDLIFQRLIEIWSNVPFLYIVIIIASLVRPDFLILVGILVLFGWMSMTWYMRTITYKEMGREYVTAARALGASTTRIIFNHILPNCVSVIVTFIPFSISGGIVTLTSLDYLGYGLPPPTPSWGELLDQGSAHLDKPWILGSVVTAMVVILTLVTFIGEAIREAFDPKKFTVYK